MFDATEFLKSLVDLFEKPELRSPVLTVLVGAGLIGVAGGKMWERLSSRTIRELKADLKKAEGERDTAAADLAAAVERLGKLEAVLAYINDLRAAVHGDQEVWNLKKAAPLWRRAPGGSRGFSVRVWQLMLR